MANGKKQSFIGGAAVLTAAVVIVKLIGAVYKIPLNNILGEVGKTYFDTAYYIYNMLLTISTAGLPVAISRLTSQAHARGLGNEKHKLFRVAMVLFFCLGLVGTLVMFFHAGGLAAFMNNRMAEIPIRTLAPSVFCVCLLSCMRGYSQGEGNMRPSAASQVLEAVCKLGVGLPLAAYLIRAGKGLERGAAGAILGVTVGTVLSLFFITFCVIRDWDRERFLDRPSSGSALLKRILLIGVPITLSNSALSIINIIDTKIIMGRLQSSLGLEEAAAAALRGQYGFAMDMVNMAATFVYPVTMSLIPMASAALARRDHAEVGRIVSAAYRIIAILAMPAGVGLSVLSTPIMRLMLPAQPEAALAAGPHLRVLGFACILIFLMILTNAILQTFGKEILPIFTVIAGGITKIVMNYILVGNPDINIHGAPISTLCCYGLVVTLNLIFVWRYSPEKPRYVQIFARPILASVLMGGAAWAVYGFVSRFLAGGGAVGYLHNAVATLCGIATGVLVYGILVIALRILRAEDVRGIPHGQKLIRLLHLK